MLLAIDVGNTNVTLGVFEGKDLRTIWRLATRLHQTTDEYAGLLLDLFQHNHINVTDIKDAAICNVVPPLTPIFEDLCQRYFNIKPLVVEAGTRTGVRIRMDNPREVGADRIVNAAAAHRIYGGPLIIADFGTATTFDTVSKEGDYIGGAITPGISVFTESLFGRTAMLPRVELIHPRRAIGTNTIAAMQSGIVFGYIGLIESIVNHIQQELPEKARVIATGGFSTFIARETPIIEIVNPDLTLVGLRLIYRMNQPVTQKE